MAGYNNNKGSYNNNQSRGSYSNAPKTGTSPAYAGKKSEAILEKLLKPSKKGTSIIFSVGKEDMVLPANTRVVISPLTEKQTAGLKAAGERNGFKGPVPTHKFSVFKIEEQVRG